MEAILIWIWNNSWLTEAACEVVALLSMAGAVVLVRAGKTRVATPLEATPAPRGKPETVPEPAAEPREARKPASPLNRLKQETADPGPQRATVQQALKAMDRWETNYRRPSRGIAELARLAGSHAGTDAGGDKAE